jgi:hypothetical protein
MVWMYENCALLMLVMFGDIDAWHINIKGISEQKKKWKNEIVCSKASLIEGAYEKVYKLQIKQI